MAKGKGQIGLTIADRSKPDTTSFDYRGNSVEQWVQDLPLGNVGATAKLLYGALHEVNRLAISWRDRQRFLELLREPIAYVQEQLHKRFSGVTFPLADKTRQIANLSLTLSGEMALGYKTAIEEMLDSSFLSRDNKALIELIHRAVYYLSCSLLTSYKLYAPHPEDTWFELHLLYLHAEHKKIHTKPVSDKINEHLPQASIARLYKQILLLALASPHRMRQGEAHAVYRALARWAAHAQIIPYNDPSAAEALFVVHMDSDDAPDFQAFNHRDCNTELCRLVDTRQLSHILQEELQYIEGKGKNDEGISKELLIRLIRSWGIAPKRSFSRNDKSATLEVVVGLSQLHRALAMELGDESQLREKARYQSRSVAGVSQPTKKDIWNIFSKDKLGAQYQNYQLSQQSEQERAKPRPTVAPQVWQVRNESAGGYRLAMEKSEGSKVQVGELLGLLPRHHEQQYEVGVVRWMRQPAEGGLEIGVQVLAPQAIPVLLRERLKGAGSEFQPALMLPEVATISLPATLITPILLFETGDELQLHHPEQDIRVTLGQCIQDSGSFNQFRFTRKEERQERPPLKEKLSPPPGSDEEGGLSIDWDEL